MDEKKFAVITYGCQMNIHESEKLAGILTSLGYKESTKTEECDVIVFNTCCIRENAEQRAEGNIGALKKLKKKNKNLIIAVGGCMTQQPDRAKSLVEKFPFIDIVFGTHNLSNFERLLKSRQLSSKKVIEIVDEQPICEKIPMKRTSYPNAWVNIIYGCNNFCTYCIVPYVRGRERSRNFNEIVEEVETLVKEGYKEITLLGQNVNSYGNDLKDGTTFSKLLYRLNEIEGNFRIRFMSSHPKDFKAELVDAIANCDKVCNYVHLPVQAGSTKVLKDMNRRYTREDYLSHVKMIKEKIPNCSISTDIMVGFPGETEEDFLDTLSLVESANFQSAFMFVYSRRKGTKADAMENQVDEDVKKDRIMRLIEKQNNLTTIQAKEYLNKTLIVLCEDYDKRKKMYMGRDESNRMVYFKSEKDLIGEFVTVKILKTGGMSLYGEII